MNGWRWLSIGNSSRSARSGRWLPRTAGAQRRRAGGVEGVTGRIGRNARFCTSLADWKNATPASSGVTGLDNSEKALNQGAAIIADRHCSVRTLTNRIRRGGHVGPHVPANLRHLSSTQNSRRNERSPETQGKSGISEMNLEQRNGRQAGLALPRNVQVLFSSTDRPLREF